MYRFSLWKLLRQTNQPRSLDQPSASACNGVKIVAMQSQRGISWVQAALLFSVCGMVSSQLGNLEGWGAYLLPIPFGILAAWLLVGRVGAGFALVVLDALVWQLAYRAAMALDEAKLPGGVVFCLAGLIGGLGVTLAAALSKRQAPPMSSLVVGALTGAICGLPFAWWFGAGNQGPIPEWALNLLCYGIWQGAVGLSLWRSFGKSQAQKLPGAA